MLGMLEARGPARCRLIINRLRPELVRTRRSYSPSQILDTLDIDLLGIVPEAEQVLVANAQGMPVAHGDDSQAAVAYHNIARRLLGEQVPFLPLLEPERRQRFGWLRLFRRRDGQSQ